MVEKFKKAPIKFHFIIILIASCVMNTISAYKIAPLQPDQAPQAKQVMIEVFSKLVEEAGGMDGATLDTILDDVLRAQEVYFDDGGIFLVILTDDDQVIGTGALKRFNDSTAEIKRITLLPGHRGHRLGTKLVENLLEIAKNIGYESVVLEVFFPKYQQAAIKVYKDLGFQEVPHYRTGTAAGLSLEKRFESGTSRIKN